MENGSPSRRSWADEELPSPLSRVPRLLPDLCFSDDLLRFCSRERMSLRDIMDDYSDSEPPSPLPPGNGKVVAEQSRHPLLKILEELECPLITMKGLGEVGRTPAFLTKTYDVVEDPDTDTVVSWGLAGKSFVVRDAKAFAALILPRCFKLSNFSDFVRVLHIYGFVCVRSSLTDPDRWEFAIEGFQRGHRELLKTIKRRRKPWSPSSSSQQGQAAPSSACLEVGQFGLLGEVHSHWLQRDEGMLLAEAPISAGRCKPGSGGVYWQSEYVSRHEVLNQGYYPPPRDVNSIIAATAGAGASTGGHNLGNLLAADGGGGQGQLGSHGSSRWSWVLNMMMTTATGGDEADLEAGGQQADGGAAPAQQPSANEEEARALRKVFLQLLAAFLPASSMSYSVLKDAPKHVKIIIFGGQVVIIAIVLFAGMLSRSLASRRSALWLVSCLAVALLTFSVAC